MNKTTNVKRKPRVKVPAIFYRRIFWQTVIALLFIGFFIYFIKNEHVELIQINQMLGKADTMLVVAGIAITLVYLYLQGELYRYSFRSIHQDISLINAINLYLKRNLISVFLPAGSFASIAFFNKEIEKSNISKTQAYYGSYIFALCSMISVVIVAIPTFLYLFINDGLHSTELYAFIVLLIFVGVLVFAAISLTRKGSIYRFLARKKPDWVVILDELHSQDFSTSSFIKACLVSVGIEFTGVVHLYIAMLALHVTPSWEAAFVGYVVMVIILSVSPVLRGMGAIEVSMTYVLTQYGYGTLIAASITLLFRLFEFWLPLLAGVFSFLIRKGNLLIRVMPAAIILFVGIINVVSAITPAIPSRMRLMENLVPPGISEFSNFAVAVFGIMLIILSVFLFLGARNAWKAAIVLTSASIAGHLVKGIDYEEAIIAALALIPLVINRKSYIVRHNVVYQRRSFLNIFIAVLAVFVYAIAGFYFLEKQHFDVDFSFAASVSAFVKIFFLFDTSTLIPHTHFARGFLYSLYISGAGVLLFTLYVLFRPFLEQSIPGDTDKSVGNELIKKYGNSALDYFKTYFDKIIFFNQTNDAFLSYRIAHNFAVVLEGPVGGSEEVQQQVISEFEDFCYEAGLKNFYYRVPEKSLPLYHSLGKKSLPIGQEAVVKLDTFTLAGGAMKSIRNAITKVEAAGFTLKIYEPPIKEGLLQKIEQVSDEWLESNERTELIFTQGLFDKDILRDCTILTVENAEEKVVAFTNIVPDYAGNEGTYDLFRKTEDAPNGTLDFLMVKMFLYFKENGYQAVNLGLAPLAGIEEAATLVERTIKFAKNNLKQMSRFKGLYDYKDKFSPQWNNQYLVYGDIYDLVQFPRVLNHVSRMKEKD